MSEFNERSRAYATAQTDAQMVYIEAERRVKELKSENAKLRQLVRVMYCHYNRRSRGCDDCLMHNDGIRIEISDIEFCEEMYELMQECGIEVDG